MAPFMKDHNQLVARQRLGSSNLPLGVFQIGDFNLDFATMT